MWIMELTKELKTTSEVIDFAIKIGVLASYDRIILCKSHRDTKWLSINDLKELIEEVRKENIFQNKIDSEKDKNRLNMIALELSRDAWNKAIDAFAEKLEAGGKRGCQHQVNMI